MVYVIIVTEPGDPAVGRFPYEKRFRFEDLEDAWNCAMRAIGAGFVVRTDRVDRVVVPG